MVVTHKPREGPHSPGHHAGVLATERSKKEKVSRVHMHGQNESLGQTRTGNWLQVSRSTTSSCQLNSLAAGEKGKSTTFSSTLVPSQSIPVFPKETRKLGPERPQKGLLSVLSLSKRQRRTSSDHPTPVSFPDLTHLLHTPKRSTLTEK